MAIIYGTNKADTIAGSQGADLIASGNGDDIINAGAGNDLIFAGNGDDIIDGGSGDDLIDGGNGDDIINGGVGNDLIYGGNGDDDLDGGSGDDIVLGGNGDDVFIHNVTLNIDINNCTTDYYDGQRGMDTLKLIVTSQQLADLQAALNAFATWDKSKVFNFVTYVPYMDLKVINIEKVVVEIVGASNHAPTDITLSNVVIAENAAGAVIGTLVVVDPDMGDSHTYAVSDTRFEVVSGQLKLKAGEALDFEMTPIVNVSVTATDAGGLSFTKAFNVTVTDVNEAPTAVLLVNKVVAVAENGPDVKVADIAITDDALGTNVLSLSGADAAFFEIRNGNELWFKGPANYEAKAGYDVIVMVNDPGLGAAPAALQNFHLDITNVNEAPTAVLLVNKVVAVAENGPDVKVADIAITDDALGTNVLSLSGADAASFEIRNGNELWFKGAANYEVKAGYDVVVMVNDPGLGVAPAALQNFHLDITNVNEAPTLSADSFTPLVNENVAGAILSTLAVADPDAGDTYTYELSDPRFEVVAGQLRLRSGVSLNFEAEPVVSVNVIVTDAGGLSDTKTVLITVKDVAEAAVIGGVNTGSVTEDDILVANGLLTINDPDGAAQNSFLSGVLAGNYGTLSLINTGVWSYSLNNSLTAVQALNDGQSLIDTIQVQSIDGTPHTIAITINGANEPIPFDPNVFDYLMPETHAVRQLNLGSIRINNMPDATLVTLGALLDFSINGNNRYQFSLDQPAFNFGQAELLNTAINSSANNAIANKTVTTFGIDTATNGVDANLSAELLNNNNNLYAGDFTTAQNINARNATFNYGSHLIYGLGGDDKLAGNIGASTSGEVIFGGGVLSLSNTFNFGKNVIYGGNGNDLIAGSVLENGAGGGGISVISSTLNFSSNKLYGGVGNDILAGNVYANGVNATIGGPSLNINFSSNLLEGGSGNDILYGNTNSISNNGNSNPGGAATSGKIIVAANTFIYDLSESGGLGNDIIKDYKSISGTFASSVSGARLVTAEDVLRFDNLFDVNGDMFINIADLVALTDVINDGSGNAKVMIYNSLTHNAAHLVGSVTLEHNNIVNAGSPDANTLNVAFGVAFSGPLGGSNEITDYSGINVVVT